ncbi:hypothetical protein GYMLUDRAFT_244445 [Collybiopsis luxurians FD-317 M1]|uniref:Fork-head domain-containing protein n=1 Tax=Collybiopsis luxurians FD-317 M1 TaxID=944289 RepID=A0A0D0BXN9_9AGAR|nr:hypothetical protein GYMLUDRAFT_244445 [Collybiopsis luxurians FD-317 M1]
MAQDDGRNSPISQLLTTLGLTREDLQQRSDEMRQFLTAENDQTARVASRSRADSASSTQLHSLSRSNSIISTSARSASRASTSSFRDASPPPVTPVKSEPTEASIPHRPVDNMDVILERQRQARKERRQRREKERDPQRRGSTSQGSPTPSSASSRSLAFDPFFSRRDDDQVDVKAQLEYTGMVSPEGRSPPPLTPQQSKYYREHTVSQSKTFVPKVESPASTAQQLPPTPTIYPTPYYPLPQSATLAALQALQGSSSALPVTPTIRRIQGTEASERSPLPPSSPLPTSPQSSPVRGIVNLVSSPGPMGPPPEEESYGKLPYTLPAGPYSPNKPDLSYAALLGQAILSSPDHRLTLQEIYDWITIVYPFFKRGETTWMNSIRHVLSTTACFRKVTRDRALGRTQWAIWDEDLECFKGGGFRKQFCKDMNGGKNPSEVSGRAKRGRKQVEDNDVSSERKSKKAKKDVKDLEDKVPPRAIAPAHSIFPTRPAPPLQPYREASVANQSVEVIFPPLPAESAFRQLAIFPSAAASSSTSRATSHVDGDEGMHASSPASSVIDSQYPPSSASTSSVPELTPNNSSSSPPPSSSEMETEAQLEAPVEIVEGPLCLAPSATVAGLDSDEEEGSRNVYSSTTLTPVRFWNNSPRIKELSKLGGKLNFAMPSLDNSDDDESDDDGSSSHAVKNKHVKVTLAAPFDRLPPSPTNRKSTTKGRKSKAAASRPRSSRPSIRLSTPPPRQDDDPHAGLKTPPRNRLEISPVRTPLSHKGLHMSPSASLAHYKSHLDPPPTLPFDQTSSSTLGTSGAAAPSTPKRSLAFPLLDDSPFRVIGMSPFRTPGSNGVFDPHDPRALLDEEFRRLGPGGLGEGSPAPGIFGKERTLLYDSPSGIDSSPGKYKRWW